MLAPADVTGSDLVLQRSLDWSYSLGGCSLKSASTDVPDSGLVPRKFGPGPVEVAGLGLFPRWPLAWYIFLSDIDLIHLI